MNLFFTNKDIDNYRPGDGLVISAQFNKNVLNYTYSNGYIPVF